MLLIIALLKLTFSFPLTTSKLDLKPSFKSLNADVSCSRLYSTTVGFPKLVSSFLAFTFFLNLDYNHLDFAQTTVVKSQAAEPIEEIPLYTKKTSDLQLYSDISRGYKLLRFAYSSALALI